MFTSINPGLISRRILAITLIALSSLTLKAQDTPSGVDDDSLYRLRGWFSFSSRLTDFTRISSPFTGINVNLYAGMHLSDWVSVCVGPGLRTNAVQNIHIPIYGGFRLANRKGKVSPHIFLAGGYNTDPVLGKDVGHFHFLSELGLQIKAAASTSITFFVSYETLPMYLTEERLSVLSYMNRKVPQRYQLLSIGFTFGF